MESGFYQLMEEEARRSVEAEIWAKIEAKIEAEIAEAEEARAKIIAEIRQQATCEYVIESILNVLDVRFQSILVPLFKAHLEQIDNLQQLWQLYRAAIRAPSLETFAETLVQNGNN